jgi:hypothetical protein
MDSFGTTGHPDVVKNIIDFLHLEGKYRYDIKIHKDRFETIVAKVIQDYIISLLWCQLMDVGAKTRQHVWLRDLHDPILQSFHGGPENCVKNDSGKDCDS